VSDPVVVMGGGLAGVACAHKLGDEGVDVVLVDRNDYHQFQPLLYQVATSQLPVEDIARPHRTIFKDFPTVQVVTAHVDAVSFADRSLGLRDGRTVAGSHLVMAAGARPNFFGTPGAEEHAFPLYSVTDAERLRRHLQHQIRAATSGAPQEDGTLDVVVVGGGPTGVETTGGVVELMAALEATGQTPYAGRVTLVDRGDALLGAFADKAHTYAHTKLTASGVELRLGTGVAAVHADRVELTDGTVLPARTVVWAGGESAARAADGAGPAPGRGGRIDVLPDLSVDGYPGVYAIGDVANIPDADGAPLPQLGSVAQQSGVWAAQNILRDLDGVKTEPFHYKDKGIMAMIGRNAAVAEVGKRHHLVEGPIAFAAWLGVHASLLSGAHSTTDAFLTWGWDYFDRDHSATVEASTAPQRIAWGDHEADAPHIILDEPSSTTAETAGREGTS
jgi:NADH dehydrogenase